MSEAATTAGTIPETLDAAPAESRNPFDVRDYRFWWGASIVASLGIGIQVVTVPLFIRDRVAEDERAAFISAALIVQMLPGALLALVGGVVADRSERRLILVRAYAAAAAVSAVFVVLAGLNIGAIWPVFLLAAVVGSCGAFANPARSSMMAQILSPAQLQNGVILGTMAFMAALQFGGPSIGGLVADGAGLTAGFGLEVVLLAAGAMLFLLVGRYQPPPGRGSIRAEMAEGLRYARNTSYIPGLMLLAMAPGIFFMGPMQVNMVILVEDVLHQSDKFIGILFGCFGAGVVFGSMLMTLRRLPRRGVMLICSLFAGCACFFIFGLSETMWITIPTLVVFGMGAAVFINLAATLLQENTSRDMMGRVMSIYSLGFLISQPIGLAQAGIVSTIWGPQVSIVSSAIGVGIVAALCLLFLRPVRQLQ